MASLLPTLAVVVAAVVLSPAAAFSSPSPSPSPPACNLTGSWCCEETTVVQSADGAVATNASYGTGVGTLSNLTLSVAFSNSPGPALVGTVDPSCSSVSWSNGAVWTRSPGWPGPATPAPAWARNLTIYELNPRGFTSPNGTGADGSGSGTWASLTGHLPYLAALGVNGLWVAGYCLAEVHFYNIWSE
jgi:hypothetical protein